MITAFCSHKQILQKLDDKSTSPLAATVTSGYTYQVSAMKIAATYSEIHLIFSTVTCYQFYVKLSGKCNQEGEWQITAHP